MTKQEFEKLLESANLPQKDCEELFELVEKAIKSLSELDEYYE